MEIVNQLAGSLAQSAAVTRQQSTDKSQQVRRAQNLQKNVATASSADSFEHQVESTEELTPIHDEPKQNDGKRKKRAARTAPGPEEPAKPESSIDITG